MEHRTAKFFIEREDGVYPGLASPETWNGFACPLFTREVVERMVAECPYLPLSYDAERDAFIEKDDDGDDEVYEAIEIGGSRYYAVGAWSWAWHEEIPDDGE